MCLDRGAGTYFSVTKKTKLDACALEAMMIGYSFASKGYNLWDPELKKVIIYRSVKFDEENISVDVGIEEHSTDVLTR